MRYVGGTGVELPPMNTVRPCFLCSSRMHRGGKDVASVDAGFANLRGGPSISRSFTAWEDAYVGPVKIRCRKAVGGEFLVGVDSTFALAHQVVVGFGGMRCRLRAADTALRLGIFFGMEPRFWLNLRSEYHMRMADGELRPKLARRIRVFEPQAA